MTKNSTKGNTMAKNVLKRHFLNISKIQNKQQKFLIWQKLL